MNTRKEENEQKARDVIHALSNYVNECRPIEFLVDSMANEHPTIQQQMTIFTLQWLLHLSTLHQYDLRNSKSISIAKAVRPILEAKDVIREDGRVHLPCI